MMGSGKSTIGRALARATGWPYVDNDDLVRRATGRTSRELASTEGEDGVRRAEADALGAAFELPPPVIVGIAAGTVLDPALRDRLRAADDVVWLRAAPDVLASRARGAEHRPWLDADPEGWFRTTDAERAPLYAEVADLVVDTDTATPDEAVAQILAFLGDR